MSTLSLRAVRLAVIPNRERDLRSPSWALHEEFLRGVAAHKTRRARECRKVPPAIDWPWRALPELHRAPLL